MKFLSVRCSRRDGAGGGHGTQGHCARDGGIAGERSRVRADGAGGKSVWGWEGRRADCSDVTQ